MSMPSPFELGGRIGSNISEGIGDVLDVRNIDKILSQASSSTDPNAIEEALKSVRSSISPRGQANAMQALESFVQRGQTKKQNQAYLNLGIDPNLPDAIKLQMVKNQSGKNAPKDMSGAIQALDTMEHLIKGSGIGQLGGNLNYSPEARRNRGLFTASQAAILPILKQIFPRGMTEKEFLIAEQKWIPQPNESEDTIAGKIQGLRQILQSSNPQQAMQQSLQSIGISPQAQTTQMRDKNGDVYDIPNEHIEQARAQGFI